MNLDSLRDGIDRLDDELLRILNERMELVHQIGVIKNTSGAPIYRPEREKEIISRLKSLNNGKLNSAAIEAVYLEIFAISRNLERPETVAYLGPEASFTHQAAESRFGAMSEYLSMNTIKAVFKSVESGRARYAVVPIENNTDGIVGETLDLLGESSLKIVAELYLPIHHAFATKCERLSEVKRIYSRDVAFGQCRSFLSEYNLENVERFPVESTAKAARLAYEEECGAAICSSVAARLYNVPVLYEDIEDDHNNRTRFLILSNFDNKKSGNDKTSIFAHLRDSDKPGTLVSFLQDFQKAGINLTKIDSRPVSSVKDFSFWFFIDFEGHYQDENVQSVLCKYENEIKWLGSYVKAE